MKAYQVKVGDKLPPSSFGWSLQTVKEVTIDLEDTSRIMVETDQGAWFLPIDTELLFPRRNDGASHIFFPSAVTEDGGSSIAIDEICVGDLVPNELGWRLEDDEPVLYEALLVTNIVFSGHGTYLNLYSNVSRKTRRLYVPLGQRFLFGMGCVWEEYGQKSKVSARATSSSRPPTASGVYLHQQTAESVSFRIAGSAGRPRQGSIAAPSTRGEWFEYVLLPGQKPHPEDPRLAHYLELLEERNKGEDDDSPQE